MLIGPMPKYKDQVKPEGKPVIVKRRRGEPPLERHRRRKKENLKVAEVAREWAEKNGLSLSITNQGHHWSFYEFDAIEGDPQLFEWWPSSAKMVVKKNYKQGVHVHDIYQLIATAQKRLARELEELRERTNEG